MEDEKIFRNHIASIIERMASNADSNIYRTPLVGYASTNDPIFLNIKTIAHSSHMSPEEILPGAKSVIAYFLPYREEFISLCRKSTYVAKEWAQAYVDTNNLLSKIADTVINELKTSGYQGIGNAPTYEFDKDNLVATWSHRHAAYAAGLGTFGHNNMLITASGCAGRFGSVITDADISADNIPEKEYCLRKQGLNCNACISHCPVSALTENGFDRHRCYDWLLEVDRHFSDMPLTDVCGKCCLGVCANKIPGHAV